MSVYSLASAQAQDPAAPRPTPPATASRPQPGSSPAKGTAAPGSATSSPAPGVARGTFYLYFDSKEQVFLAIVADFHKRISQRHHAPAKPPRSRSTDPEALLRASFRRWLGFFADNRDATTVILKEASSIDPRFEQGFADLRRSAVDFFAARYRRLPGARFCPALDSPGADGASPDRHVRRAAQLRSCCTDPDADLDALAAQLADFEWNGIRPH